MRYKTDDRRWEAIRGYLNLVLKRPSEYPDGVLLSLDDEEITALFTKERIRMIRLMKSCDGLTMSDMASKLKRKLPAVERDLKILEGMGIVELKKKGRVVYPVVEKEVLIIPLMNVRRLKEFTKDSTMTEEDALSLGKKVNKGLHERYKKIYLGI